MYVSKNIFYNERAYPSFVLACIGYSLYMINTLQLPKNALGKPKAFQIKTSHSKVLNHKTKILNFPITIKLLIKW